MTARARRILAVVPMTHAAPLQAPTRAGRPAPPACRARGWWAAVWFAGLAGCGGSPITLTGTGPVVREARPLAPGTAAAVEVQGALDLDVQAGAPLGVFVEGHADLLEHVDVELRAGVLRIEVARGLRLVPAPRVAVELPALARLGLVGSGTARVGGIAGDALQVELVGSGDVVLEGRVGRLDLQLSGSGELDAGRLVAGAVHVDQQGSGRLTVHAVDQLSGRAVGSGDLETVVKPAQVELRLVGSGQLRQRE